MALDISPGTNMATTNMIPEPDEAIDALYGANVGDFLGALRARPVPYINGYGTNSFATTGNPGVGVGLVGGISHEIYVFRVPGHNKLVGTYFESATYTANSGPDCYGTGGPMLFGNLGTYNGVSSLATGNVGGVFTSGSTFVFSLDLDSYLSVGSWGTLVAKFNGTLRDTTLDETFTFSMGTPAKVYTTWA